MWIKTKNGKKINTNNICWIEMDRYQDKWLINAVMVSKSQIVIREFDNEKDAETYISHFPVSAA